MDSKIEFEGTCRFGSIGKKFNYEAKFRNEALHEMHEKVFLVINGNEIAFGEIISIRLGRGDEYLYGLKINEDTLNDNIGDQINVDTFNVELRCSKIFNSIQKAKESAIETTKRVFDSQMDDITKYFKQFE